MNLKQFKYVAVLNEEGCFSKAAEVLNISQPSLSQYIKNLENQLGVSLFDRTGGNVRLTDAGRVYVEAGKKILDIKHDMQLKFIDIIENKTGTITIGATPYRSSVMIPEIAKRFKQVYPGIHLVVKEMNSNEIANATEHGEFDIAITVLDEVIENFDCHCIANEELILAVPYNWDNLASEKIKGRKYEAIDVNILNNCDFVMLNEFLIMQRTLNSLTQKYGVSLKTAAVVNKLETQIAMVKAGIGMALVPSGIESLCSGGEVKFYSFKQELPQRKIYAVSKKGKILSQTEQELLKIMTQIDW